MHGRKESASVILHTVHRAAAMLVEIGFVLALTLSAMPAAQAQTYSVIHNFTGGADRGNPFAGLTMDAAGNLYGTTCGNLCYYGGDNLGTVFKLTRRGSSWLFTTLYYFRGGTDGAAPYGRVIIGPDGTLYGTTYLGGGSGCGGSGCGTVFNLKPPASLVTPSIFGGWTETVAYSFQGGSDGASPALGDLAFDSAGNIFGATAAGGPYNAGTVFQLARSGSGWTEGVLYSFTGGSDGNSPLGGVILDGAGNLYGTTMLGGSGTCNFGTFCGVVFELTPSASGWTETVLHYFQGGDDAGNPIGGLAQGAYGIIGTTSVGGYNGGGTAFVLNNPMFVYGFTGNNNSIPWPGPWSSLVYGPAGAPGVAYGTTFADGAYQNGSVFYMYGCAGWDAITLHDFTGGQDGGYPVSNVVFDAAGNMFGTTTGGGAYGNGVVFEISATGDSKLAPAQSAGCAASQ